MKPLSPSDTDHAFAQALASLDPGAALAALALRWKAEGATQPEVYALFLRQLEMQASSSDERLWDALADIMDLLVGWCAPDLAIFNDDGQATPAAHLAKRPDA